MRGEEEWGCGIRGTCRVEGVKEKGEGREGGRRKGVREGGREGGRRERGRREPISSALLKRGEGYSATLRL